MEQSVVNAEDAILDIVDEGRYRRIGIDGVDGVGKSTLARNIRDRIDVPMISLDDYLEKNRGGFVEQLKYEDIRNSIARDSFVIEGVCLLQVLDRLPCTVDLIIYVQRFAAGVWSDESTCDFEEDVEIVLSRERAKLDALAEFEARQKGEGLAKGCSELPGVSEEIIRYHDRHRPHARADVLYQRSDC